MKDPRPTTPSQRHTRLSDHKKSVTRSKPYKRLTSARRGTGGRGNTGKITTRHKGGGHKRRMRGIDFSLRDKQGIPSVVESVEYDPNRSGYIVLLLFADGERRYMLAPQELSVGEPVAIAEDAEVKPGNRLALKNIPVGTSVFNIELKPEGGGKIARSAGNSAEVSAKGKKHVTLKMPSSEVRKVSRECFASVGTVSNPEHRQRVIGKAGRNRWLGKRPTVRGQAMNPVDHPYGGGEAHHTRGTKRAKTYTGRPAGKGQKTRNRKKYSNKLIVSRRKSKKKKK
ncbi:MAG: 50S ribosomal protein L2 [Candidatus Paceibacterota bacterium]